MPPKLHPLLLIFGNHLAATTSTTKREREQKLFTLTGVGVIYARQNVLRAESSSLLVTLLRLRFYIFFCLVKYHCCCVLVICIVRCSEIGLTVGPLIVCTYNYVQAFDRENSTLWVLLCPAGSLYMQSALTQ